MKIIRFLFGLLAAVFQIVLALVMATGFVLLVVPGILLNQLIDRALYPSTPAHV